MANSQSIIPRGTLRIKTSDLKVYEKTARDWKRSSRMFPEALEVIHLFKKNKALGALVDSKDPRFLKGQCSPEGKIQGARINVLPDGSRLDKAYSLFSPHLTLHDESSHAHWDVLYQNPGGTYSYSYTLAKRKSALHEKYEKVARFKKKYALLEKNVTLALSDKDDSFALPMYTLLKTYMRVGNEVYFKAHGHKGLTTLKKSDISIKDPLVTFTYLSKGGVPVKLQETFPQPYLARLKEHVASKRNNEFIFTDEKGKPLRDTDFMHAFETYCGERFYPHLVRSFYATNRVQQFIAQHKKATKKELSTLFTEIAEKLGHKRFVKKENAWKDSYTVTIHHYLDPATLERALALTK